MCFNFSKSAKLSQKITFLNKTNRALWKNKHYIYFILLINNHYLCQVSEYSRICFHERWIRFGI